MKSLFIVFATISLSFSTLNATPEESCAKSAYRIELRHLLQNCKPFFDTDLSGSLQLVFKVDAENKIEIVQLSSQNVFLESHALCALQGAQITSECLDNDEIYAVHVVFQYPTYQ